MTRLLAFLCIGVLLFSGCASSAHTSAPWPSDTAAPAIPDGIGVNIHFTDPRPGEMKMLATAGFRWIRMDLHWQLVEVEKGKYDFSPYDRLIKALDEYNIRALFILDYSHSFYDQDRAPYTEEGRRAFANWAAAAARRYRGRGILWEIYNEPNTGFWVPEPKVSGYIKLALEASRAIRAAAPGEAVIGPAVWGMDFDFLESCFKAGLLDYWSGVSVHPYRQKNPETVIEDYARLRELLGRYSPAGKRIDIISSEWGYTDIWPGLNPARQASLLARELLVNHASGITLSIWYDWRDDGKDPMQIEHHWGTVLLPYYADRDPAFEPKPAYRAAQTLTSVFKGYRFSQRLPGNNNDDFVLVFSKGEERRLAAWTVSKVARTVVVPLAAGLYRITAHTGENLGVRAAGKSGLSVTLTEAPQYVVRESAVTLDLKVPTKTAAVGENAR